MIWLFVVLGALFVAFANGATNNFKGFATLMGCATTHYRLALFWAIGSTFLGDGAAIFLADDLIKTTGGKGLIDDGIVIRPEFAAAVALGTGLTLLLATLNGMPVSTTHG